MTGFVVVLFCLTYAGMAAGRVPGLRLDRSGIAMIAAVLLVVVGALTDDQIIDSIHFPTLLLLAGLMVFSARVGEAGLYHALSLWIARQAKRPHFLLASTIAITGVLSAFLVNDIVVFAMTPLLCQGLAVRGLDPRPYLFALAGASNSGSAATLIGNPQNIMIGQVGGLDFWAYLAVAAPPAIVSLVLVHATIAFFWRSTLAQGAGADVQRVAVTTASPTIDRTGLIVCGAGAVVLLALFATPLPREISALLIAACVMMSRTIPSRQLLEKIDVPLIILFASLFVVSGAFTATGVPQSAMAWLSGRGLLPEDVTLLALFSLFASNTIGNVPAVVLLLDVWRDIPEGVLIGLAIFSTLAGNLLLVGSLANIIVAERARSLDVELRFRDHARAGIPMTLLSLLFAGLWLAALGYLKY